MDGQNFDTLTRRLGLVRSRRRALGGVLLGALGLVGGDPDPTAAKKKPCPPCKKRKKGKCKATLPEGTPCSGGSCQGGVCLTVVPPPTPPPTPPPPPMATCSDTIRNGNESDVDCGGSCPRCANTRSCISQDDCRSALCVSGVCQACAADAECGIDADGACLCQTHNDATQERVCTSRLPGNTSTDCDHCPDDVKCVRTGLGDYTCFKPCGAA